MLVLSAALALLVPAMALNHSHSCAAPGGVCGVAGLIFPPCCSGSACVESYLGVGTCRQTELAVACAAQGAPCGVHAEHVNCCSGSECTVYHESFVCASGGHYCIAKGGLCGYEGSSSRGECCSGSSCQTVDLGLMRCKPHHSSCAVVAQTCSVDGYAFAKCCQGFSCTDTFNGVGKCADIRGDHACAAQGSSCGPGTWPVQCCSDLPCKTTRTGAKKCARHGDPCVPLGHVCGVPGSPEHGVCCGSRSCRQGRNEVLFRCL